MNITLKCLKSLLDKKHLALALHTAIRYVTVVGFLFVLSYFFVFPALDLPFLFMFLCNYLVLPVFYFKTFVFNYLFNLAFLGFCLSFFPDSVLSQLPFASSLDTHTDMDTSRLTVLSFLCTYPAAFTHQLTLPLFINCKICMEVCASSVYFV